MYQETNNDKPNIYFKSTYNKCLHLVIFACILSDEKARKTFHKKVAMCSDGGEWRYNFHFSMKNTKILFFLWSNSQIVNTLATFPPTCNIGQHQVKKII